jgi:hypothetical protein
MANKSHGGKRFSGKTRETVRLMLRVEDSRVDGTLLPRLNTASHVVPSVFFKRGRNRQVPRLKSLSELDGDYN